MQWFVTLMEKLGIECQVGHPAKIRAAKFRKQKHDRRDADLILTLVVEDNFQSTWLPSKELLAFTGSLSQPTGDRTSSIPLSRARPHPSYLPG
jgi:transposase